MQPYTRLLHLDQCIFVVKFYALNTIADILMNVRLRVALRIASLLLLTATLAGCNIQGFFTSYGDDPVWVDPNADAAATAEAGAAGGAGKAIYSRICAACHLGNGKGSPGANIPPLAGSAIAQGDATLPIKIVLHGLRGPIVREGVNINGQMAAWKDAMSDQEIADVLTYVRSSFGNAGAAVTADEVAAVRSATADRLVPYTEAEL